MNYKLHKIVVVFVFLVIVVAALVYNFLLKTNIVVGGIYSVSNGKSKDFVLIKVLTEDKLGVHLRIFSNRFSTRPETIELSELTLGTMNDEHPGMEHLPLLKHVFFSWSPKLITKTAVEESELVGYREWVSAKGGYWGNE